jgi:ABC-type transport system involved in multi-copper enzyme maturation permease subunit
MITQFLAVLNDSLRLLLSRKLFWLSIILSAIAAVALFGTYTFRPEGIRFFWFETWKNPMFAKGSSGPGDFVGYMFNGVFVKFWLAWGAIILAVISTASILPEFLAGGSIDMTLSKPISRLRLFSFKVFGALLFVALQVSVGVGLAYLIIGLKFDIWLHKSLWAIPLITLQFFYLYSLSALIAVVTRSTLACVMGTILLWFLIFLIQFTSNKLDEEVVSSRSMIEQNQRQISRIESAAKEENREPTPAEQSRLDRIRARVESMEDSVHSVERFQRWGNMAKLSVPKTGDIQTIIAKVADAPIANDFIRMLASGRDKMRPQGMDENEWDDINEAGAAAQKARRALSIRSSIASSLVFSIGSLGLAAFIFWRRDF